MQQSRSHMWCISWHENLKRGRSRRVYWCHRKFFKDRFHNRLLLQRERSVNVQCRFRILVILRQRADVLQLVRYNKTFCKISTTQFDVLFRMNKIVYTFCCKMWGGSLVWNQYIHPVDAEVKFCKYRFSILFFRGVLKATLIMLCFTLLTSNFTRWNWCQKFHSKSYIYIRTRKYIWD